MHVHSLDYPSQELKGGNVRADEDCGNTWAIPDQKPQHGAGVPHASPCRAFISTFTLYIKGHRLT